MFLKISSCCKCSIWERLFCTCIWQPWSMVEQREGNVLKITFALWTCVQNQVQIKPISLSISQNQFITKVSQVW